MVGARHRRGQDPSIGRPREPALAAPLFRSLALVQEATVRLCYDGATRERPLASRSVGHEPGAEPLLKGCLVGAGNEVFQPAGSSLSRV